MTNQDQTNLSKTDAEYAKQLLYATPPASIDEFLESDEFMGSITKNGTAIFPRWREEHRKIAKDNQKYIVVFSGATSIGKTSNAVLALLYRMHLIMCLRDPFTVFPSLGGRKLVVAMFNLTKSLADSKGLALVQSHLLASPWFRARGRVVGSVENPRLELPLFEIVVASPLMRGFNLTGRDLVLGMLDEVDSSDATKVQQEKILKAYDAGIIRLENRFVYKGNTLGRFFLVASKQDKLSFLNAYVAKMKNSPRVYVVEGPVWEFKKELMNYSGKHFLVSVGDVYHKPEIIKSKQQAEEADRCGFQIIKVPIEYKESFQLDCLGSLRDIAGISVSGERTSKLFPSESVVSDCFDLTRRNPCRLETIEVGLKDEVDLMKYLDISAIVSPRNYPRCIHQDFSYSGDATGLAMSCISGWTNKAITKADGNIIYEKVPVVDTDFAMRIKAKPGDRIPLDSIRRFIMDLRNIYHFNIIMCTFDLRMATEDTKQLLEKAGFVCDYLSVDKHPEHYRNFASIVNQGRWRTAKNNYLFFELKNLEDDPIKNKVDHPKVVQEINFLPDGDTEEVVMEGSKDMCFTGDTKISLVDGRELTIPQIIEERSKGNKLYVYSVDTENRKILAAPISNAFQSGVENKIYTVLLDNGERIDCTANHPFIRKNGQIVKTEDLLPGDSLLPLYRRYGKGHTKDYRLVFDPFFEEWHYEHRLFSGFLDKGLNCKDWLVHHKNFNKMDNSPPNLQIMNPQDHARLHGLSATPEKLKKLHLAAQKTMATKEWKEKQAEVMRRSHQVIKDRGSYKNWVTKLREQGVDPATDPRMQKMIAAGAAARRGAGTWIKGLTKDDPRVAALTEKSKATKKAKGYTKNWVTKLKESGVDVSKDERIIRSMKAANAASVKKITKIRVFVSRFCACGCGESIRIDLNHSKHKARYVKNHQLRGKPGWTKGLTKETDPRIAKIAEDVRKYKLSLSKKNNHKVISITSIQVEKTPVYNLTVEGIHTYALSAGVFVHNCDAVTASATKCLELCKSPPDVEFMVSTMKKIEEASMPKTDTYEGLLDINPPKKEENVGKKDNDSGITNYVEILRKTKKLQDRGPMSFF
jgi:hypothetical protein